MPAPPSPRIPSEVAHVTLNAPGTDGPASIAGVPSAHRRVHKCAQGVLAALLSLIACLKGLGRASKARQVLGNELRVPIDAAR